MKKMRTRSSKNLKIYKIVLIVIWVIIAFWLFVPVGKFTWVFGLVLSVFNALMYLILGLLMLHRVEKKVDDILLLFIPVYVHTGINLATSFLLINRYAMLIISLITMLLTVLSLTKKPDENYEQINKTWYIVMGSISIILTVFSLVLKIKSIDPYQTGEKNTENTIFSKYNEIIILAVLLILFLLCLFCGQKKKRDEKVTVE